MPLNLNVTEFNVFEFPQITRMPRLFEVYEHLELHPVRQLRGGRIVDGQADGRDYPYSFNDPDVSINLSSGGSRMQDQGTSFHFGSYCNVASGGHYVCSVASYMLFDAPVPAGMSVFTWNMSGRSFASKNDDFSGAELTRQFRLVVCDQTNRRVYIDEHFSFRAASFPCRATGRTPASRIPSRPVTPCGFSSRSPRSGMTGSLPTVSCLTRGEATRRSIPST